MRVSTILLLVSLTCSRISWAYKHTQSHITIRRGWHINFFLKIFIQEDVFNIKLRDMPLANWNYDNKSMNSSNFCNWNKCLLIIHTILLRVSFGNQPSFILLNRPIIISLDLIHPTITNNTRTRSRGIKSQVSVLCKAVSSSFIVCC